MAKLFAQRKLNLQQTDTMEQVWLTMMTAFCLLVEDSSLENGLTVCINIQSLLTTGLLRQTSIKSEPNTVVAH